MVFSGSGSGTAGDPYVITTVVQLQEMNDYLTAYFILGNDIDASSTRGWNGGAGFVPVGDTFNMFTGNFDGQGLKIKNLFINRSTDYIGLFGHVGTGGVVKNVGMESVDITGFSYMSSLVGVNKGTVSNCYSTGSMKTNGWNLGGLVGYNTGAVSNSYSSSSVAGSSSSWDLGGFVGRNGGGTVSNCYSTGSVSGGILYVGGFVGRITGGTVSNSFWDKETSGQTTSAGGTGKTTAEMKDVRTFTDVGWSEGLTTAWDFVGDPYDDIGTEDIWNIAASVNKGYPFLTGVRPPKPPVCPKKIKKVEIGKSAGEHLDLTAIEYVGKELVGSGPGGAHVSPQTVLNSTEPSGILYHHKVWEVVVGLNEDEFTALFGTDVGGALKAVIMDGENPEIGYLAVTQELSDGTTETWEYQNVRAAGVSQTKMTNEEGKYIAEIKFLSTASALYAGAWPKFRHNLMNTGRSPHIGAHENTLKWEYPAGGAIGSSPAIGADGSIYVGSDDGKLYALNPDGTLRWTYQTGGAISSSPAVGTDGVVYVGSSDAYIYAINPDGTFKWKYLTISAIYSSPAIDSSGVIYVAAYKASNRGRMYALYPNGTLKWSFQPPYDGSWIPASPTVREDGKILFGDYSNPNAVFWALNPDGTEFWRRVLPRPDGEIDIWSTAAVDSATGNIYFGGCNSDKKIWALSSAGAILWSYPTDGVIISSPAIGADGTIYIGSSDGKLYALDSNGVFKWSYPTGGAISSSPAVGADGLIYVGSSDNKLYAINPNGTLKWSYETGGSVASSPAIGDGVVYVGSSDGKLYAIGGG